MWVEPAEDVRLRRNSHVQGWLLLATLAVVTAGGFVLLTVSEAAGLYVAPAIARLGRGTFDYIDLLFFIMWAWTLQLLSVHNGLQYRLTVRRARVPRSGVSDVGGFIAFTLVAILWGALVVHPVFAARAVDPTYINRLPSGVPAGSLQQGAVEVTITYFVLVGIVLVLILAARLFNPVDFDEYDRYLRKILHLPPSRKPTQ